MPAPRWPVLSVTLALAGCGGEESSKPSASSSGKPTPSATPTATATATAEGPSEKEWAADVTAICKRNKREVARIVSDVRAEGLSGNKGAKAVLLRSVPVQRRLLAKLDAVEAPAAISEDYNFFVERLKQAVPLFKSLALSLDNRKALAVLEPEFKEIAADTRPFAVEHGLKACLPDQG